MTQLPRFFFIANVRRRMFCMLAFLVTCAFSAASAAAFTPQTGQWWNPNESGTGYNIDVYNGVLVMTIYSYDKNGDSQWYLTAGSMSPDERSYSGTLDKYMNGQCISCGYSGRPTLVGNDGTIVINFLSETSATLTLPGGRVTMIQPFFPTPSSTALAGTYQLVRATVTYLGGPTLDTADGSLVANGTMVIAGSQISQSVSVTVNGVSLAIAFAGTFVDYGPYVIATENGIATRVTIVSRSQLLITAALSPAVGNSPPFSEIDQWELVSTSATAKKSAIGGNADGRSFGRAIGELVERLQANH